MNRRTVRRCQHTGVAVHQLPTLTHAPASRVTKIPTRLPDEGPAPGGAPSPWAWIDNPMAPAAIGGALVLAISLVITGGDNAHAAPLTPTIQAPARPATYARPVQAEHPGQAEYLNRMGWVDTSDLTPGDPGVCIAGPHQDLANGADTGRTC